MIGLPLRVFISSTTDDLGESRQKVAQVVTRLSQVAVSMETFGASSTSPQEVSVQRVLEADILVGLIGFRYGAVTAMEYDAAVKAQKLVLVYVPSSTFAPSHHSGQPPSDPRLVAFVQRIQRESHTCGTYRDQADLPAIVAADLHRVIVGGAPGILAYRKGLRELQSGNYASAIYDLGWAVHLLPDDGAPAFLLALALLHGMRPRLVTMDEIKRVMSLIEIASRLSPSRAVFALWGAIEIDYFVRNGFHDPHEDRALQFWLKAKQYQPDPYNFDLIFWLQPDFASEYLEPFI